jgi:hypothetical protein
MIRKGNTSFKDNCNHLDDSKLKSFEDINNPANNDNSSADPSMFVVALRDNEFVFKENYQNEVEEAAILDRVRKWLEVRDEVCLKKLRGYHVQRQAVA